MNTHYTRRPANFYRRKRYGPSGITPRRAADDYAPEVAPCPVLPPSINRQGIPSQRPGRPSPQTKLEYPVEVLAHVVRDLAPRETDLGHGVDQHRQIEDALVLFAVADVAVPLH